MFCCESCITITQIRVSTMSTYQYITFEYNFRLKCKKRVSDVRHDVSVFSKCSSFVCALETHVAREAHVKNFIFDNHQLQINIIFELFTTDNQEIIITEWAAITDFQKR